MNDDHTPGVLLLLGIYATTVLAVVAVANKWINRAYPEPCEPAGSGEGR